MLQELSALLALAEYKTMSRAASRMHLSQSAVSKRIKKLEAELKRRLVEPKGRNVILSPYAERLLFRVRPALADLRLAFSEEALEAAGLVSIIAGQYLLAAWGAQVIAKVVKALPDVQFDISSAFGHGAIEQVVAGEKMLALARGTGAAAPDLASEFLAEEKMVIIPSGIKPFRLKQQKIVRIMFVGRSGEATGIIQRKLTRLGPSWGVRFEFASKALSTMPLLQMARAGFGNCIVSYSLAHTMGIDKRQLVFLPDPGITIPVSILGRASTFSRPVVQKVIETLKKCTPKML